MKTQNQIPVIIKYRAGRWTADFRGVMSEQWVRTMEQAKEIADGYDRKDYVAVIDRQLYY